MTLAFEGIRIIDFTQVLAGPFATQQLAQLGADVIKIEQPGKGDQTRGLMAGPDDAGMAPSFLTCNLGKRSMTLNLKASRATEVVHALVRTSDAVVENFTPGVMGRLGLGYHGLKAIKPDLVYCSISGYGQTGPKATLAAYDGAIQAASGMMAITGHPETGPTRTGYMPVDMATALNSAFAIAAALYRRQATGEGQHIDVAMMDTAMIMQAPQVSNYLVNGVVPELFGNRSPTRAPTANVFATSNGHVQVVALKEDQVEALFGALGLAQRYHEPTFSSAEARVANTSEVSALLSHVFVQHETAHWMEVLAAARIPVAEIREFPEVTSDPQFQARHALAQIQTARGLVRVVAAGHTANVDAQRATRPPPQLGEHTQEILEELGYSRAEVKTMIEEGVV